MPSHVPVLIVGAGISGLVCAYALRKSGIAAQIVESSPRPGGFIRTEQRDGYLLELGPQSFLGTPELVELCSELGIEDQLLTAPRRAPRFLLINGKLRPAPLSPPAFFASSLFSWRTKWRVLRDLLGHSTPPQTDESIATFIRRKFSAELLERLVGPFVSGIYAGDAEKLSLRAAFPQLHEAERTSGSVIRGMLRTAKAKQPHTKRRRQRPTLQTFRDGNETLVKALVSTLGSALRRGVEAVSLKRGASGDPRSAARLVVKVRSSAAKESIEADRVVLATPPNVAASLLGEESDGAQSKLGEIEFAPVAVVSLGYARTHVQHSLEGFGFLIPRSCGLRTLGTVWNSSLFPGRAPTGQALLTSFVGGATDPEVVTLSPEQLAALVHKEIAPVLGILQPPTFFNVTTDARALPQYNLGHADRLAELEKLRAQHSGLRLVGNYLRGPSIGACVEEALAVADEIHAHVSAPMDRSP